MLVHALTYGCMSICCDFNLLDFPGGWGVLLKPALAMSKHGTIYQLHLLIHFYFILKNKKRYFRQLFYHQINYNHSLNSCGLRVG